jgi:hypothetical protein
VPHLNLMAYRPIPGNPPVLALLHACFALAAW